MRALALACHALLHLSLMITSTRASISCSLARTLTQCKDYVLSGICDSRHWYYDHYYGASIDPFTMTARDGIDDLIPTEGEQPVTSGYSN